MKDYLILLAGTPRGGIQTWKSLVKYVKNPLDCDIALVYGHIFEMPEYLIKHSKNLILNLGSEAGFSVLEIIERVKSILKIDIPYKVEERRVGDVAKIVSSSAQAEEIIKWKKKYSELDTLIKSTWQIYNKKI